MRRGIHYDTLNQENSRGVNDKVQSSSGLDHVTEPMRGLYFSIRHVCFREKDFSYRNSPSPVHMAPQVQCVISSKAAALNQKDADNPTLATNEFYASVHPRTERTRWELARLLGQVVKPN